METQESILAREAAIHFECKKDGLRQTQDGGVKVTFNINPNDMPKQLYTDPMGTRYVIALVALNEDETPKLATNPSKDGYHRQSDIGKEYGDKPKSHAGEAKLLVKDGNLIGYITSEYARYIEKGSAFISEEKYNEYYMKKIICINSCSELIEGSSDYERFKKFKNDFYSWKRAHEQEQFYTA